MPDEHMTALLIVSLAGLCSIGFGVYILTSQYRDMLNLMQRQSTK